MFCEVNSFKQVSRMLKIIKQISRVKIIKRNLTFSECNSEISKNINIKKNHNYIDSIIDKNENLLTILSINNSKKSVLLKVPPLTKLYFKRNSLILISNLGNDNYNAIKKNINLIQIFKSIFYESCFSIYDQIISTTEFNILISSSNNNSKIFQKKKNNVICSLSLNGITDWAVLKNKAIQFYCGSTLRSDHFVLPIRISKKLSNEKKISKKTNVGLSKFFKIGYTLVSGKGIIGILGEESIMSVEIEENEELTVRPKNLIAISVDGNGDLENCVFEILDKKKNEIDFIDKCGYQLNKKMNFLNFFEKGMKDVPNQELNEINFNKKNKQNKFLTIMCKSIFLIVKKIKHFLSNCINKDDEKIIKIIGPRKILIQTSS